MTHFLALLIILAWVFFLLWWVRFMRRGGGGGGWRKGPRGPKGPGDPGEARALADKIIVDAQSRLGDRKPVRQTDTLSED